MSIIKNVVKLLGLFNKREKINSAIMLALVMIGGFAETLGIGVVLPFATILLDQNSVEKYPILKTITEVPWIGGYRRFIVLMSVALVLIFVLKSLYMFFLIYIQNRFTLNRQIEMSKKMFQSYIYRPYEFFFKKNTAELQRNIGLVTAIISGVLMTGLQLLTELVSFIFIFVLLLLVDPITSVSIVVVLSGIVALYYFVIKNKLEEIAKKQNEHNLKMGKAILEGMGGIKDVKVLGRERSFLRRYEQNSKEFAKTHAFFNLASQSPRLLIETIAISGLVIIIVINALRNPDMSASLPTMALFGMAAIKIMPAMNRIIGYVATIRFNNVHFNTIYEDLLEVNKTDVPEEGTPDNKIQFDEKIEIKGVTYRYPGTTKTILEGVDLEIRKGDMIGIVGRSGGGKTTLVDIVLGLLKPEEGSILVDGFDIESDIRGWRRNIGYVPQNIFIVDDSVTANVALGVPEDDVDTGRVWDALEIANLKEHIDSLEQKLDTNVGQSGVKLSGGQRQRLGIARALYHDPSILIFDEATSSLDNESERAITEAIARIGHSKTMLIIAHRLNTLEKCDVIYEVRDSKLQRAEYA